MARRTLLLATAFVGLSGLASAQAPSPQPSPPEGRGSRKRIVLALAGGGAYGLMHLGALEWLERHRVPVDAIAGTSGGALVGGWYATGLELLTDDEVRNPVEPASRGELRLRGVREVLQRIDFDRLFESGPDYRNRTMLQKRERRLYPNDLFAGVSDTRALRRDGLVPGQKVGFFLDWIGRDHPDGFESLPIPFRAVAVDATAPNPGDWRRVVLGGPSPEIPLGLSRAIRASIAVPLLFAPVEAGGRRLIDGAVLDNLPTDVANDAFAPDVLIALRWDSGFGPDPYRAGRLHDTQERAVVTFDPRPYRVDQFGRWRELAWIGYRGMEAHRAELLRYALPLDEYLAHRAARRVRRAPHVVARVEGPEGLRGIREAVVGRDLDDLAATEALGVALDRKVADEGLATAGYDLLPNGTLRVRTTRHKGGPALVRGGLETELRSGDRFWPGVRGRVSDLREGTTRYWLDGALGMNPAFGAGLDVPLGRGLSLSPQVRLDRQLQFRFAGDRRLSEVAISTAEAALGLVYRPSRSLELTAGGFALGNDASGRYGASVKAETGSYQGPFLRAELDTADDAVAPRAGTRAVLEARHYGDFGQATGALDLWRRGVGLHLGFGVGGDAPFPLEFRPRLDAYRRDEVRADRFLSLALTDTRPLGPLPFAFGRLYLMPRLEGAWNHGRFRPGVSLSLLGDTRAGAFRLGFAVAEHGAGRAFLELGRRF